MSAGPYPAGILELHGCPESLPSLADGERRVCGMTIEPMLAAQIASLLDNALVPANIKAAFELEIAFSRDQVTVPDETSIAIGALTESEPRRRLAVGKAKGRKLDVTFEDQIITLCGLDDFLEENDRAFNPLPASIPMQKVRVEEVGPLGLGLFATENLSFGHLICPVGGYLSSEFSHLSALLVNGQRTLGGLPHIQNRVFDLLAHTWHIPMGQLKLPGVNADKFPRLCLNGLGYGNESVLVNDPSQDPLAQQWNTTHSHPLCQLCDSQAQQKTAASSGQPGLQIGANCEIFIFIVRHIPIPWLVVTAPINEGEQLFRNYGSAWWAKHSAYFEMAQGVVNDPAAAVVAARYPPSHTHFQPPPPGQHNSHPAAATHPPQHFPHAAPSHPPTTHSSASGAVNGAPNYYVAAQLPTTQTHKPKIQDTPSSSAAAATTAAAAAEAAHKAMQTAVPASNEIYPLQQGGGGGGEGPKQEDGSSRGHFTGSSLDQVMREGYQDPNSGSGFRKRSRDETEDKQEGSRSQAGHDVGMAVEQVEEKRSASVGSGGQATVPQAFMTGGAANVAFDWEGKPWSHQDVAADYAKQMMPGRDSTTPPLPKNFILSDEQWQNAKRDFVLFHLQHAPNANGDYLVQEQDMPGVPGWQETLASESEADVKADQAVPVSMTLEEMQSFTIKRVTSKYAQQESINIKPVQGKS